MKNLLLNSDRILRIGCILLLLFFLTAIVWINFSHNPHFYDADMYADIMYSMEAWAQKSLFPSDWVFGNQLYVVATPVLAALFYGLGCSPLTAMSFASCIMTVLVLLIFVWMLKAVTPSSQFSRLIGLLTFIGFVIFCGDAHTELMGWQLYFTMCSYYACYAVTVFLAFGCYLRLEQYNQKLLLPIILTGLLSFCTGIHSLRQTAVMVLPMIVLELLTALHRCIRHKKLLTPRLLFTALVTVCNCLGLWYASQISSHILQAKIFGSVHFVPLAEIPSRIGQAFMLLFSLFYPYQEDLPINWLRVALICAVFLLLTVFCVLQAVRRKQTKVLLLLTLMYFSVGAVLAISVLTTIVGRNIYFFMLQPLLGVLTALSFSYSIKSFQAGIMAILLCLCALSSYSALQIIYVDIRYPADTSYQEVSDYLQEQGCDTIYSSWNWGQRVAIASDFKIEAAMLTDGSMSKIPFLTHADVFSHPEHSAYVLHSMESVEKLREEAAKHQLALSEELYFSKRNLYVLFAPPELIELLSVDSR